MKTKREALHPSLEYHLVNTLGWTSLRPLQKAALPVLLAGKDALLLAPTAGGKTEAAIFPLLSRQLQEDWQGLSVLYVCPLRALLNDLHLRLEHYASLVGRRVGVWHGDVASSAKAAIRRSPPDLLLTTPESLEGLLVSRRLAAAAFFSRVRAVVVDEIHAFAGDDRGWHLLAVLGRIEQLAGRKLQRIGLSATVGNPKALLEWLTTAKEASEVVKDPSQATRPTPDVKLDWVGTLPNAAHVIASLHRGEKRMVFCDSRSRTEDLAHRLGELGVNAFISHSSLSRELRTSSEQAFTAATEGVIVATSTLELGIDLGDLDRVVQIDAPSRVANFLQRLGRTGRRPGTRANCLFLATHDEAFLRAVGLLQLYAEGYVEPVVPPPHPYHVLAQQLMAVCLQTGGATDEDLKALLLRPPLSKLDVEEVLPLLDSLYDRGILFKDAGRTWLGAEGERRFQRRQFMDLLSMITDSPLFTVIHGQQELGQVDRTSFFLQPDQPTVLLLAGRSWRVEHIDWRRKRCWVKAVDNRGRSRWLGKGPPLSFELCQAIRRVLARDVTPPGLTRRAAARLEEVRSDFTWLENTPEATCFQPLDSAREQWWTYAGLLGNATLLGVLGSLPGKPPTFDSLSIVFTPDAAHEVRETLASGTLELTVSRPQVHERTSEALKFADCLPPGLVDEVVAARWSDQRAAEHVIRQEVVILSSGTD